MADHCRAIELGDLLAVTRPIKIETPGYAPEGDNGIRSQEIITTYIENRLQDNRTKTITKVNPEYIFSLQSAKRLAFNDTFYNPLRIDAFCANDNSTIKHFRGGSFNVLSLGDVESTNIAARLRRCSILGRETDVMILAHHGADNGFTTKTFVRRLEPSIAICSADYANQYDHPRQEIRNLLHEEGIRIDDNQNRRRHYPINRRSHRTMHGHQPECGIDRDLVASSVRREKAASSNVQRRYSSQHVCRETCLSETVGIHRGLPNICTRIASTSGPKSSAAYSIRRGRACKPRRRR